VYSLFDVLGCYRLDQYLYDYFIKRKLHKTAAIFREQANVAAKPVGMRVLFFLAYPLFFYCLSSFFISFWAFLTFLLVGIF
jgi:hypothetical protein